MVLAVALIAGASNANNFIPLLWENPESVFDGEHEHYVNLSTGNLSLRARDLRVFVEGWDVPDQTYMRFDRINDWYNRVVRIHVVRQSQLFEAN